MTSFRAIAQLGRRPGASKHRLPPRWPPSSAPFSSPSDVAPCLCSRLVSSELFIFKPSGTAAALSCGYRPPVAPGALRSRNRKGRGVAGSVPKRSGIARGVNLSLEPTPTLALLSVSSCSSGPRLDAQKRLTACGRGRSGILLISTCLCFTPGQDHAR